MKASLSSATSLIALLLAEGVALAPGYRLAAGALLATGYMLAAPDPALAADTRLTTTDPADFAQPRGFGAGALDASAPDASAPDATAPDAGTPKSRAAIMPAIPLLDHQAPGDIVRQVLTGHAGYATETAQAADDGGEGGGVPSLGFYVAAPEPLAAAGDSVFTGAVGRISLTDASATLLAASSASYAYSLPVNGAPPADAMHEAFVPGAAVSGGMVPGGGARTDATPADADLPLDDADLPPPAGRHEWTGWAETATASRPVTAAPADGGLRRSRAVFRQSAESPPHIPTASSLTALIADPDASRTRIDAFCITPSAGPACDDVLIPIRVVASELPEQMSANLMAFSRLYGGSNDAANRFVPMTLVLPQKDPTNVVERIVSRLMDAVRGLLR